MYNKCIGLFGTCDKSKWRDAFMNEYDCLGIKYFNPMVENWKPEDAIIEAEHLANDGIILFPVTSESYGMGSLAETGFSILQAIRYDSNRFVVVYIDHLLNSGLEENPDLYKASIRTRALVIAHLKKMKYQNVYVVDGLESMLKVSITLHSVLSELSSLNKYRIV